MHAVFSSTRELLFHHAVLRCKASFFPPHVFCKSGCALQLCLDLISLSVLSLSRSGFQSSVLVLKLFDLITNRLGCRRRFFLRSRWLRTFSRSLSAIIHFLAAVEVCWEAVSVSTVFPSSSNQERKTIKVLL